jgi:uncharacterized protein
LLDYKVNINTDDHRGESPLYYAVRVHNDRAVEDLIELGANPHTYDANGGSLWNALAASPSCENREQTPCENGERNKTAVNKIVQQLIAAKIDINEPDHIGTTALDDAIRSHGEMSSIELLLNNQARIDIRKNDGNTPLISAIETQNFNNVKMLLDRGGGVNFAGKDGKTPLMVAIRKSAHYSTINLKIVKILIDRGADISFLNPARRKVLEQLKSAPPCNEFDCNIDPHKLFDREGEK